MFQTQPQVADTKGTIGRLYRMGRTITGLAKVMKGLNDSQTTVGCEVFSKGVVEVAKQLKEVEDWLAWARKNLDYLHNFETEEKDVPDMPTHYLRY